jgi:hypothetical protein
LGQLFDLLGLARLPERLHRDDAGQDHERNDRQRQDREQLGPDPLVEQHVAIPLVGRLQTLRRAGGAH